MNASEIMSAVNGIGKSVEDLKSKFDENYKLLDARIENIEQLPAEKVIRPGMGVDNQASAAFSAFIRKGDTSGMMEINAAMRTDMASDGGVAVPEHINQTILDQLLQLTPMRRICTVTQAMSGDYKRLVNTRGLGSGWVSETASRTETDTPNLEEVAPVIGEIYANPAITQRALDDMFFDVEPWIIRQITDEFSVQELAAFTNGDASNKPKGFLTYTTSTDLDSSRAFGTLQHIAAAGTSAFTADELVSVLYSLKSAYRQGEGVAWMMNSNIAAMLSKLKDADGRPLWRESMAAGEPATLFGYPVVENENMPDATAGETPIAFGNWRRGYEIVDRGFVNALRDPYSNKPYVHFYTTKRVGGAVIDSNAIKLLKLAAA